MYRIWIKLQSIESFKAVVLNKNKTNVNTIQIKVVDTSDVLQHTSDLLQHTSDVLRHTSILVLQMHCECPIYGSKLRRFYNNSSLMLGYSSNVLLFGICPLGIGNCDPLFL
jgi:hypothetical protein